MSPHDVVVVGGGVAGLGCAHALARAGRDVLVLEREAEPGGSTRTAREEGFVFERGPHTILASADAVFELVGAAGLEGSLVGTRPEARARFIARDGRLHAAPLGPLSLLRTRLLSAGGKLALAGEPFRRGRGHPDETAASFFARRFGPEAARVLAGAFVSGVYAGDPERLSARAAFPLFWSFEQTAGSMILGALRHGRRRRRELAAQGLPVRRGLHGLAEGLGQLTRALAVDLGDRVVTGAEVRAIRPAAGGFELDCPGATHRGRAVVLAAPPPDAGPLLGALDSDLADLVGGVPMARVAVVHLGFRERAAAVPEGFGFLVPPGEGLGVLGVLFPSRLFEGRAPAGGDLLTAYLGGAADPGVLELDDATLVERVLSDLRSLVGLEARPDFVRVRRHPAAIPQLVTGHIERMEAAGERLAEHPGLFLAGGYSRGVGLKDAAASGLDAAAEVLRHLGG